MRRNLALAGVVTFVVLDIALVSLAVHHASDPSQPVGSSSATPTTATSVPTVSPTSPSGRTEEPPDSNGPVLLSLSDDGTAIRATPGSCKNGDKARVEISSDTGATFDVVKTTIGRVLRVEAVSDSDVRLIGTNSSCEPRRYDSDDLGASWKMSSTSDDWYLGVKDKSTLHSPSGSSDPGCTIRALSVVDKQAARVACTNGVIRGTGDGGDGWSTLGTLVGVRDVAYLSTSRAVALATTDACPSQVFTTINGGSHWDKGGCIDGKQAGGVAAVDRVALAEVDGEVFRSIDGGKTWKAG